MATADKTSLKNKHYAPINVKPQGVEGEGRGGRPRGFDIFTRARVKLPAWAPRKCEIPTRYRFLPETGRSYVKFPTPGQNPNDKIPTHGNLAESISRG